MESSPILVCFAVKEEAKFFNPQSPDSKIVPVITGMGQPNAAAAIQRAVADLKPRLVITAGFAGGLNSQLKLGTVVFDEDSSAGLRDKLLAAGAIAGTFHCAQRVVVTAAEKRALHQATGADAVEMESSVIRDFCHQQQIPSATIRVISDAANEDLPLDFNALMTANNQINFVKLAGKLLLGPQKIPQLLRFQKQTMLAARNLAKVLEQSLLNRA
jgi:adenosylhomocysteine nucleosidase